MTDEVTVLTGLTAAAALKRELRVPFAAIRSVSTERYAKDGLRLGGASIPFGDLRAGRFRRNGLRTFVSFEDRYQVVTPNLDRAIDGVGYDLAALGTDDPEAIAAEITTRLG